MLSPNELEVMKLLWSENRALSRSEIIELSPNSTWKPSTIHLLLNSLLKKGVIQVEGFKQTGKNYGRTFAATMTEEEYTARELQERLPKPGHGKKSNVPGIFAALVDDPQLDDAVLDELQAILDKKRGQ